MVETENKYIPNALKKLKMVFAFKGYTPSLLDCIEVRKNKGVYYVMDDNESHFSRYAESLGDTSHCLEVINVSDNHEFVLLSLDHRLVNNHPGGIADCCVFDETKFAIVEFKTNSNGRSKETILSVYDNAIAQIDETIRFLNEKEESVGVDFMNQVELVCYVVVNNLFPRIEATEMSHMVDFALNPEHLGVELTFDPQLEL